jgi:hypothetical protein
MALTKATVDAELVGRNEGYLTLAGWSVVVDGTNPKTVGPIRTGLNSLGIATTTLGTVVEADLATVTSAQLDQLYDVADLRLKRDLLSKLPFFDQKAGPIEQKLSQARTGLLAEIADLKARIREEYGIGAGRISVGSIDYGFAQTDPTMTDPLWPYG